MEIFEIHITGTKAINEEFDKLGIKNIVVDLLTPTQSLLRTEYMSSFIYKEENFESCKEMVNDLLSKLKSEIIRVKIECPFYEHYVKQSLYMESHFEPFNNELPISVNARSGKHMATDRTYNQDEYPSFLKRYEGMAELELCLLDTFVDEDKDWFDLYSENKEELLAESK